MNSPKKLWIQPPLPVRLNKTQRTVINIIQDKVLSGKWTLEKNPCLCGRENSILIANRDRYGLQMETKLCLVCGLMRVDPYYSETSLTQFYSDYYRKLYNTKSKNKFFKDQYEDGQDILKFCREFLPRKASVLEVGCGAGGILEAFRRQGHEVIGLDYDQDYLNYGKEHGLNLNFGSIHSLRSSDKFDLIIVNHVLEHIPSIESFLRQLKPYLKPSGYLYASMPGLLFLPAYYGNQYFRFLQNAHCWHFTLFSLSRVLGKHGFRPVQGDERIRALFCQDENKGGIEGLECIEGHRIVDFLEWSQRLYEERRLKPRISRAIKKIFSNWGSR
jgi:2-polyprenyl-3-methyl-5-hydroxy-6-metoxy-1,4-benzoquinol methylase